MLYFYLGQPITKPYVRTGRQCISLHTDVLGHGPQGNLLNTSNLCLSEVCQNPSQINTWHRVHG